MSSEKWEDVYVDINMTNETSSIEFCALGIRKNDVVFLYHKFQILPETVMPPSRRSHSRNHHKKHDRDHDSKRSPENGHRSDR